jgi:hypothetical protein
MCVFPMSDPQTIHGEAHDHFRRSAFDIEGLLDTLAEQIAQKLLPRLAEITNLPILHPRLLTVDQAAIYLGRSKEAIQHMVANRTIPFCS